MPAQLQAPSLCTRLGPALWALRSAESATLQTEPYAIHVQGPEDLPALFAHVHQCCHRTLISDADNLTCTGARGSCGTLLGKAARDTAQRCSPAAPPPLQAAVQACSAGACLTAPTGSGHAYSCHAFESTPGSLSASPQVVFLRVWQLSDAGCLSEQCCGSRSCMQLIKRIAAVNVNGGSQQLLFAVCRDLKPSGTQPLYLGNASSAEPAGWAVLHCHTSALNPCAAMCSRQRCLHSRVTKVTPVRCAAHSSSGGASSDLREAEAATQEPQ